MHKEKITLEEIKLVGLSVRTNNKDEMTPGEGKIPVLMNKFLGEQVGNTIQHRLSPGKIYSVYTEFESDENGEYTYFVGEAVSAFDGQNTDALSVLTIAPSLYQRFTTDPGQMPDVVIQAWQKIWTMGEADFQGKRSYLADFEIYDERAADPAKAVVDIYIGIS